MKENNEEFVQFVQSWVNNLSYSLEQDYPKSIQNTTFLKDYYSKLNIRLSSEFKEQIFSYDPTSIFFENDLNDLEEILNSIKNLNYQMVLLNGISQEYDLSDSDKQEFISRLASRLEQISKISEALDIMKNFGELISDDPSIFDKDIENLTYIINQKKSAGYFEQKAEEIFNVASEYFKDKGKIKLEIDNLENDSQFPLIGREDSDELIDSRIIFAKIFMSLNINNRITEFNSREIPHSFISKTNSNINSELIQAEEIFRASFREMLKYAEEKKYEVMQNDLRTIKSTETEDIHLTNLTGVEYEVEEELQISSNKEYKNENPEIDNENFLSKITKLFKDFSEFIKKNIFSYIYKELDIGKNFPITPPIINNSTELKRKEKIDMPNINITLVKNNDNPRMSAKKNVTNIK